MRCAMLLLPHANVRYNEAVCPLAECELSLLLGRCGASAETRFAPVSWMDCAGAGALEFELPESPQCRLPLLARHSACYLFCQVLPGGALLPLAGPSLPAVGEDLSGILKYKGKTNERFTRFLLNCAWALCEADVPEGERLRFADPMCGRGTALFEALNLGWDAFGSDRSAADVREGEGFYRRYLEYHRRKHTRRTSSMTLPAGGNVPVTAIRAEGAGEARFAACEASALPWVFGRKSLHIVAADLPYGVQHAPGAHGRMTGMEEMLRASLPAIAAALRPGGVAALSFNTNTLPRSAVLRLLEEAGLQPFTGGTFETLSHWVEQAVTRDACFAARP